MGKIKLSVAANQCDVCNKVFSSPSNLKAHKIIHTGQKPFKCNICGKNFARNLDLKYHKRTHTGERPYECKICDKRFKQAYHLTYHLRIHNGEKPYKCELCSEYYRSKEELKIHQRAKHNQPKLKCTWDGCYAEFNQQYSRLKHIKAKHDPVPYHCDQCNRKYAFKRDLDHHKRKHEIMNTRKSLRN